MEKLKLIDAMDNEEVLITVKESRTPKYNSKEEGKLDRTYNWKGN